MTWNRVWLALWLLGLNWFDAVCTVNFVHAGGIEANPLMAWLLNRGDIAFILFKLFAVPPMIVCVATLARAWVAWLLLGLYAAVMCIHILTLGG